MIYLGADHRGYNLKENIKKYLTESGQSFEDMGNFKYDPNDDYTDFAKLVAEKVSQNTKAGKGILICGSGVGVDITANKFHGVRSALADDIATAKQSREHDDTNVLSLPADEIDFALAQKIVSVWLSTPFSHGEKSQRRIDKMEQI
ncbi:MAG: RpiB/LacA/LacB family sugar-phosphate isomerase [Patescibacteria group bacterium]|nr:RpiB/LacA/LacB family sugar-phosphate isomerase [Patescibacteria group bacterium]